MGYVDSLCSDTYWHKMVKLWDIMIRCKTYYQKMDELWDMSIVCVVTRTGIKWLNYGIVKLWDYYPIIEPFYVDLSCRHVLGQHG